MTTTERKEIAGVPCVRFHNYWIPDLEDERVLPKKNGVISLVPVNPKKFQQTSFRSYYETSTGIMWGQPTGAFKRDGTPEFRRILISRQKTFDLSVPSERKDWAIMQHWENIQGTRNANRKAVLKIHDEEREAEIEYNSIENTLKAMDIVTSMNASELRDFARVLSIPTVGASDKVVKTRVAMVAKDKPKFFMEQYNNENRGIVEIIQRAKSVNVIQDVVGKGLLYDGSLYLGASVEEAVATLAGDTRLLNIIDQRSKNDVKGGIPKKAEDVTAPVELPDDVKEKLARLEALEASLATKKAQETVEVTEEETRMYKGKPVSGKKGECWTMGQLVSIAVENGIDEEEYKKLKLGSKDGFVDFLIDKGL